MQIENLNIVFKISERCNLKCDYCYFFFGGDDTWKKHPPFASRKVVEDLGAFSVRAARDHRLEVIDIVFHGGEPLLMSKPRFSEMCDTLRGYENGFRFSFALQTNGVLVDDGWIDIFERHRITVGVSLDGPPPVNDLHRLDHKGHSSYDATVAGLRELQSAAAEKRIAPPGLLCVISPFSDGAATYRHFVDDLGVNYMSFLTPDYSWDSVVPESVVRGVERFLLAALRAWLGDKNPKIKVRVFSELLAAMVDPRAMEIIHNYRDDYRNIISVSSNGDLGPEDTLRTLDPRFASMGLNIANHNLSDVFESEAWQQQTDALAIKPHQCEACDWWKICKAGRPVHRYSKTNAFSNHSLYCSGLKDAYTELAAFVVRNGTPLDELALRLTS